MKQKTVFVIEQGSYSDYSVIGVYSTRQNAEIVYSALKEAGSDELHEIAEWNLDPATAEIRKGYKQYCVLMLRDGTVEKCTTRELSGYSIERCGSFSIWKRTEAPAYSGKGVPDALMCDVFALNEKHAIKISNEHRAMMIANGEWE